MLIIFCLFVTTARAQDGNSGNDSPATTANENDNTPTTTASRDNENEEADNAAAETREATTTTSASSSRVSISDVTTITTNSASSAIPSITGTTQSAVVGPSDLPTLTGIYNTFSYPPPTVPPTENAPFMQTSSLPDGTVFIAVGAILGAFGAAVLIWRGIVACLLHRSVERAAVAQHAANDKTKFPAPPAQFYKYSDHESKVSLTANRRTTRGHIPSSTPSQTNLFFSPTAPGTGHQPRDSRAGFLPNGFYPAGGSTSPQGALAHQNSISLTNLRPSSRGQIASFVGPSPPESPSFGPSRSNPALRNVSTSSLNRPSSQRAPSAYLEDLLDENPQAFPPQAGVPPLPSQHGSSRI